MIHQHLSNSALSENHLKKLLKKIRDFEPGIIDIHSQYIHFSKFIKEPKKYELDILENILSYGEDKNEKTISALKFIIIPRLGTISPWSSKATDIAKLCHLNVSRIERGTIIYLKEGHDFNCSKKTLDKITNLIFDRMTETIIFDEKEAKKLFFDNTPKHLHSIDIIKKGELELHKFNKVNGLALSDDEIKYLYDYFSNNNKNPTDAELMMFAQANSEHCRHKIFNAKWIIDGKEKDNSLFSMIKNTHLTNPEKTVVAYSDNSSIVQGNKVKRFYPDDDQIFKTHDELTHYLMKVETHNHPTAISPFPGAATGSGGEIRDEGATGRGSKPKAGLTGFSVSNLHIDEFTQSWEGETNKPNHIASPLEIMIDAPVGGASYNNEFGRPNISGYFRVFEQEVLGKKYGYHKPIMLAGGVGNISDMHTHKKNLHEEVLLIQIGGPAMLIGLGGGAASSMASGSNIEDLDFASVQRGNPEIQRRAQEVIDRCWQMQDKNPILSIHDVGAGGLSNAFPELVNDGGVGAKFNIRDINSEENGMAPHELWCNESQERYVIAIDKEDIDLFESICLRERCPFSIVGHATNEKQIIVNDSLLKTNVVDMDLDILLGKPPKTVKNINLSGEQKLPEFINHDIEKTALMVLAHPSVASKKFLIHIGDRSVTGLVSQDQMVGPWQIPVSNVAVTKTSFEDKVGEAFAIGERAPIAVIDSKKSAGMAIGESLTNILCADIGTIKNIKLSANWMSASGDDDEDAKLYEAVHEVGINLCPKLGISIPVGKDSMSMKTKWADYSVTSPVSLIVTSFSECLDVTKTLTPELDKSFESEILYIDLGENNYRCGGSIAEQVHSKMSASCPELENPKLIVSFSEVMQDLIRNRAVSAYHDRSDGGLFACLTEMAFSSRSGINIDLSLIEAEFENILFAEELGVVIQVKKEDANKIIKKFQDKDIRHVFKIGSLSKDQIISFKHHNKNFTATRSHLEKIWSQNSFQIQSIRDNEKLAKEEFNLIDDDNDPGINESLSFKLDFPKIIIKSKPQIAILRDQGINGHYEMAAAFHYAGFQAVDIHMQDLILNKFELTDFKAFVACGGFSYGDVLGAGEGWSKVILNNTKIKDQFESFFNKPDTIALGVCNGCQMMSNLKKIIPGTEYWPKFVKNVSDQFESRVVTVKIPRTNSIFFKDMYDSYIPVITAHGEGRAIFDDSNYINNLTKNEQITLQYVNNSHKVTSTFPFNPNGSPEGVTGLSCEDGRFNIMMPHPERVFRTDQQTWNRYNSKNFSAWHKIFLNAHYFLNNS